MKISVLTSSRSDYSIYLPLLKALQEDDYFDLRLIVFGTHLSKNFGYTVDLIETDGFVISNRLDTMPMSDEPYDISFTIGETIKSFSKIWVNSSTDLIIALGDRYEMFAACIATIPYSLPIAHIHGGEETLGAIDNIFRHSISHIAKYHFVTTDIYAKRVQELKGSAKDVYNVGALSIDNLKNLELLSIEKFREKYGIDLSKPTILITFHPETVSYSENEFFIDQLIKALQKVIGYQFVITMPNSDTMGSIIRKKLNEFIVNNSSAYGVESLGTTGYLSCMKHCSFMLGNTSSGFVEASYFPKYVINLGSRQNGRIVTPNIFNCEIKEEAILKAIDNYNNVIDCENCNIYGSGNSAEKIKQILKYI